MTDQEATNLSLAMRLPMFSEAKQQIARELFDYYKALLQSRALPIVPTTRRWM